MFMYIFLLIRKEPGYIVRDVLSQIFQLVSL
jgi:hypothetical protein